jgi:hypothetical protein
VLCCVLQAAEEDLAAEDDLAFKEELAAALLSTPLVQRPVGINFLSDKVHAGLYNMC